jgi:saccharopine dehydrogenase-like NADP-dependent oxidoreductase
MKIIVTGASGVQGRAAIVYLLEQNDISEIKITDIREDILKEMVKTFNDKRLVSKFLDLTDYANTVKEFTNYDVVLNCALTLGGYLKTTKAAMEAGANYTDLTTKGERDAQQTLAEDFKKKKRVCVQDMGAGPGMTNIIAAYLMNKLDKTDTIDFKMITIDRVPPEDHSHPLHSPITFSDIMYLFSNPTYYYENGALKNLEPRALAEKVTFDEPIGTQMVAGEAHSEPICLSRSFRDKGIKRISYKGAFGDDLEKKAIFLRDLGFADRKPIEVKGQKVVPYDVLQALIDRLPPETKKQPQWIGDMVAIVTGEKDGKKLEYRLRVVMTPERYKKMAEKGCLGQYRAGIIGAIGAVIIGRGQVKVTGVVEPELSIPPDVFLKEMVKFGFNVEVTEKTLLLE